jgi:cathepsin L
MIYSLLATCFLLCVVSGRDLWNYSFDEYVREFGKVYDENEYVIRRDLFEKRVKEINNHNRLRIMRSYTLGVNHMSDWSEEEFRSLLGYHKAMGIAHRAASPAVLNDREIDISSLPASVDWRDATPSVVSPVKNQGHCGSCWTFASAQTIESHWALATGRLQELSQQQIAGCTSNPHHCGGTGGCEGGIAQLAFEGVKDAGGIATEWTYPYISYFGTNFDCVYNASKMGAAAVVSGHVNIPSNDYGALMEAVATKGPISISLDASSFHSYEKGVWDACDMNSPDINHAVQLVGYGNDVTFGPYWLVRNSWGTDWGENGYIRIRRDTGTQVCAVDTTPQDGSGCDGGPDKVTVCGMCGILYDNTYPLVSP